MTEKIKRVGFAMVGIAVVLGLLNLNNPALATVPGDNQLISTSFTGGGTNNDSYVSRISADGKAVIFASQATNILPSGGSGIFVKNLATGATERVNESTAGVVGSFTYIGQISATGRYVTFLSNASNLIDGTTISSSSPQLYLRDVTTSTTTLISQSLTGIASNGNYLAPYGVSSDGRFILFGSNATNLHPDSTNGDSHLYMLDRLENSLTILDRKEDGSLSSGIWSSAAMSCDGSLIVFDVGNELISGEVWDGKIDVYLLDRRGVTDKLSNITKVADAATAAPTISCNGDYIGYETRSGNLDPSVSVTIGYIRPYVYDRVNDTHYLAAVTASDTSTNVDTCGTILGGVPCIELSDTGIGVFKANDSGLVGVSGDQIYMRNIHTGVTELVVRGSSGAIANAGTYNGTISADGRAAAYTSTATNLVVGDTNNHGDVFTSLTGY